MGNNPFHRITTAITEFLNEQSWFQEVKSKWDELDSQSRLYVKFAGVGATVLLFVVILLTSTARVYGLKRDYNAKTELLQMIQSANAEIKRLKEASSAGPMTPSGETGPWPAYLETTAANAGIDKSALTISPEKSSPAGDALKESLMDISVKHVNIKQIVRYAFSLENGSRPVKIRNLLIDTKQDPAGYMDATLSVSGFVAVAK